MIGHLQRWVGFSQLRTALSCTDWDLARLDGLESINALTTMDWCFVFALPCGTSLGDCMLLQPRAPVPESAGKWLDLLQVVDSRACAAFVLCNALPCLCR